jgi:hypothetical protein
MVYAALRCTTLHYAALRCTTLHYPALRCTTLHYAALRCTTLHYAALRCTTLHYAALRCSLRLSLLLVPMRSNIPRSTISATLYLSVSFLHVITHISESYLLSRFGMRIGLFFKTRFFAFKMIALSLCHLYSGPPESPLQLSFPPRKVHFQGPISISKSSCSE